MANRFVLLIVCMLLQVCAPVSGGMISEIVVFGDSLSDSGNVWSATRGLIPRSPPFFEGRFSNGPVWVERLAEELELPAPSPSVDGGTNFAVAAARTGPGTSALGVPNLGDQIDDYLSRGAVDANSLFVVWGGGANLLSAGPIDPVKIVGDISEHINSLSSAGAKRFLVPNLPPLGQAPVHLGTEQEAPLDALVSEFNTLLNQQLDELEASLEVSVLRLDVFDLVSTAIDVPAQFGFINVTEPAYDEQTGLIVPNPEAYLFWDEFHPTAAAHRVLGDRAVALVPEPHSIQLAAWGVIGVVVFAVSRRYRRSKSAHLAE